MFSPRKQLCLGAQRIRCLWDRRWRNLRVDWRQDSQSCNTVGTVFTQRVHFVTQCNGETFISCDTVGTIYQMICWWLGDLTMGDLKNYLPAPTPLPLSLGSRYNTDGFVEELPQLPEIRIGHACFALPNNGVRTDLTKTNPPFTLPRHSLLPEGTTGRTTLPPC